MRSSGRPLLLMALQARPSKAKPWLLGWAPRPCFGRATTALEAINNWISFKMCDTGANRIS